MEDNNNKIKEKIAKLLRLSESSNEHEAKKALLKAQELMIKFKIEELNLNEKQSKNVVQKVLYSYRYIHWYRSSLANVISKNFRVTCYTTSLYTGKRALVYLGLEEDIDIAVSVYEFGYKQMRKCFSKYFRENNFLKEERSRYENLYFKGFILGLKTAFEKQVNENNWGLILVKDELVIKEEEKLGLVVRAKKGFRAREINNTDTFNKGYTEGYNTGMSYGETNQNSYRIGK